MLCTEAGSHPLGYTNDVDVDSQSIAWFSDTSHKWNQHENMNEVLENGPNGRLLKYDIRTGECEVVLGGLHFANGVAVSPDETYVLVNEVPGQASLRAQLQSRSGRELALLDSASDRPWLRKIFHRIPSALQQKPARHPFVLGLDADGNVVHNLQDADGARFSVTTSAEQAGD